MRIRRGPRLLSIGLLLAGLVAPAIVVGLDAQPAAAAACPVTNSFGNLCLLSTSQWKEDPGSQAVHLVGELRNDGAQALAGIMINLDLLDSAGNRIGQAVTASSVSLLAPGELTPFQEVLFPAQAGYDHFRVASVNAGPSTSQPVHLAATLDGADPCPTGDICRDVSNSGNSTLDNPEAFFTFYDRSGNVVAVDNAPIVGETTGATTLAPNEIGTFTEDPSWLPSYATFAVVTEPDYPVDLNPASLTFAGQVVGTTSPAEHVTLTNNGPRALAIPVGGVGTSGDFSQTNNCGASVASGASCIIGVSFTPTATGTRAGALTITDDGAGSPQSMPLSGTGTMPAASLNPTSLTFASMSVGGTSDPQTVTLTNSGDGQMTITSIAVDANFTESNTCPSVLAAGASCGISVSFAPAQIGSLAGSLTIKDNAADSPQKVHLSGTSVGAGVQLTPSSLDFGGQTIGSQSGSKPITLTNSGNANLTISSITANGDFSQTNDCPASLAAQASCTVSVAFTPTSIGARSGALNLSDSAGTQSAPLSGTGTGRAATTLKAASKQQYILTKSDGATWQPIDATQLTLPIPSSTAPGVAILSGNADLWTQNAGVNQDIGIFVGVDGAQDQLVAWKESGGFAGTNSPNAAFVQTTLTLVPGKAYMVTLKWKTNHVTTGTIRAGAGLGPFSPTTLIAQVLATGVVSEVSTLQYGLANSDGSTWQPIDGSKLALTIPSSTVPGVAILSGNADLWTQNAGVNQDIGIFVRIDNGQDQLVAWKESGGFAGTNSPNAAFVQTSVGLDPGKTYTVTLKWKTNHLTSGTIRAGAGIGPFSPTTLTAQVLATGVISKASTLQYGLTNSDGSTWQTIDGSQLALTIPSSTASRVATLSGNADLWTQNAGVNQDIGLIVNDGTTEQVVAWKESGGFAGTNSPNAAFVQTSLGLDPGKTYTVTLKWKTNHLTSGTIRAGAGLNPNFSPTTLTALIQPSS